MVAVTFRVSGSIRTIALKSLGDAETGGREGRRAGRDPPFGISATTAMATTTRPATAAPMTARRLRSLDPVGGPVRLAPDRVSRADSTRSPAPANRSCGLLAMALATTPSTPEGRSGRTAVTLGGGSFR